MAQAAEIRQDFAAAEAYLGRIDNPEQLLEVQSRRASLLARQGRLDEGRALLRQVPVQDENAERARLMAEARLLREARRWSEAFEVLGQAVARWPKDVDLLYEQSMMAEKLDRIDEMERLLRRVIEMQPDHGHAHNALGYSLADRNLRLPEARVLIVRALSLAPGDPFITDSLGWVEFRMGRISEALRLLREAYAKRPDAEIAAHLGEVLWVAGQADEAQRIWREALVREPDNEVLRSTIQRLRPGL
jgi:tetratricopeptide (TPR) repeat protein